MESALAECLNQTEFEALKVEPGRIFNAAGSTRRQVQVWNQNRTHVRTDSDCRSKHYDNTDAYVLNYSGDPNDIRIAGGYQVDILQQSAQSILVRSIVNGGELGAPIDEIPLYSGELPPTGSDHLDGGISCDKVLKSINGVAVDHFVISTNMGVIVKPHPLLNRIVIDVNGDGLTFCTGSAAATAVDCLPASGDGCGPASGVVTLCPGQPDDRGGYKDVSNVDNSDYENPDIDLNDVYGTCSYRKTVEGWQLIDSNPSFNCQCVTPTIGGYLGQSVSTRASPIPREEPYWVRNGDFADGLQYWQITADDYALGDGEVFGGMPYAHVENGTLLQPFIPFDARMVRLQFNYTCTDSVEIKVVNHRTGEVLLNATVGPEEVDTEILTDFFSTSATDVVISFQTAGTMQVSEVLVVPWQ